MALPGHGITLAKACGLDAAAGHNGGDPYVGFWIPAFAGMIV